MQKNKIKTGVVYAIKSSYSLDRGVVVRLPYVGERYRSGVTEFIRCDNSNTPGAASYSGDLSVGYLVVKALHESVTNGELLAHADKLDAILAEQTSREYFKLPRHPMIQSSVVQSRAITARWDDHLYAERAERARTERLREQRAAEVEKEKREYQETLQHVRALEETAGVEPVGIDTDGRYPTPDIGFELYAELLARLVRAEGKSR